MRLITFSFLKCAREKIVKCGRAERFYSNPAPFQNSIVDTASADTSSWQTKLQVRERVLANVLVSAEFVSAEEERSLMDEMDIYLKKMRYEFDHWDNAIHGYRESERAQWLPGNWPVVSRLHAAALAHAASGAQTLEYLHVLDLHQDGYIKPHVDSIRFCGDVIVGLCLLSAAVMRLSLVEQPALHADVLLPPRTLYVLKGDARYLCTHAVLGGAESVWQGRPVQRQRRVSVMCRTKPQ